MKNWISKNYKTIIIAAFLVPIITVAIVSISHVTMWYGLSNPVTWAVYLSIGIEIAALSALAAISADMGSKVYFPFSIVTLIQFIGNIFFAYSFIDINSQMFKDWVDLVSPLVSFMGVEPTDFVGHKRFLAFFAGGMLPVISLSFLHMLVKFTEEDKNSKQISNQEPAKIDASDVVSEVSRLRLSEEDLKKLEEVLLNPPSPNEALINAAKKYNEKSDDEILERAKQIEAKKMSEEKERQKEALIEMMDQDQKLGLYDEPSENPLVKDDEEEIIPPNDVIDEDLDVIEDTYNIAQSVKEEMITPALSDEEVRDMFMDEWERKFDLVEEEEYIPSDEEIMMNNTFNTEQVEKFNIESTHLPEEEIETSNEPDNDTFWRDHLEDDIKKK